MATEKEVFDEYLSSLRDLTINSKPLINMLTMLADDNIKYAPSIVRAIETQLFKVDAKSKLPVLYLVDSIVKNIGNVYIGLFTQNIVSLFCNVFEKVDEKIRSKMYNLRLTWKEIFPDKKLYALDIRVQNIDPNWPVSSTPPVKNIHVNRKFVDTGRSKTSDDPVVVDVKEPSTSSASSAKPALPTVPLSKIEFEDTKLKEARIKDELLNKQRELLELQQKRIELEILQAKNKLEASQRQTQLVSSAGATIEPARPPQTVLPVVNPALSSALEEKQKLALATVQVPTTNRNSGINALLVAHKGNALVHKDSRLSAIVPVPVHPLPILTIDSQPTPPSVATSSSYVNKDPRLLNKRISPIPKSMVNNKSEIRIPPIIKPPNIVDKLPPIIPPFPSQSEIKIDIVDLEIPNNKNTTSKSSSKSKSESPSKKSSSKSSSSSKKSSSSSSKSKSRSSSKGDSPSKPHSSKSSSRKSDRKSRDSDKNYSKGGFKDVKSCRTRNYVRRNQSSDSPEPDIDLRDITPIEESILPKASSEDVDLRQLPTDVSAKKRATSDKTDEPSPKKTKAEILDVLFGNQDVDLRQLPAAVPDSNKLEVPTKIRIKAADWAKFKEAHPDTYKSPLKSNNWETSSEHGSTVSEDLPAQTEKASPLERNGFDRLGRPLLAYRLSSESRERKNSISSVGEDTDMRHPAFADIDLTADYETNRKKMDLMIFQADEQLKDGTISLTYYNELLKQIVHMDEMHKLREAQRRDAEEWTQSPSEWDQSGRSPSEDKTDSDGGKGSPSRESKYKSDRHTGDVDDRFNQQRGGRRQGDYPMVQQFQMRGSRAMRQGRGGAMRPWLEGVWDDQQQWRGVAPMHVRPQFRPRGVEFNPRFPHQWIQYGGGRGGAGGPYPFNDRFLRGGFKGVELPNVDPNDLEEVNNDPMKSIAVDGIQREIRYYDDTAIVMMSWDDPREIKFQAGTRNIIFNEFHDDQTTISLNFGDNYRELVLGDKIIKIKLGAPSRELYINDKWYECFFGGAPINVEIGSKKYSVRLDGPPPQVAIGHERRKDLVAGRINLIINANITIPVFLDTKPQKFEIDGKVHVYKFADAFTTVIINGKSFRPNFGDIPMQILVNGSKNYIRFTALPPDVTPGFTSVAGMDGLTSKDAEIKTDSQGSNPANEVHQPAMPMLGAKSRKVHEAGRSSPDSATKKQQQQQQQRGQLDVISSLMPGAVAADSSFSYQVQEDKTEPAPAEPSTNVNLGELLQKLIATGILPSVSAEKTTVNEPKRDERTIKPISLKRPETLKMRQAGVFGVLYSGIQCSSCGVRFAPEQTIKYSQHLDWHFRQNRRDRDSAKKAQSRKWYYDVSDWIQFEEIEDLEERAQSWFETQVVEKGEEKEQEICTVPAGENADERCGTCNESFFQFFNQDKEEWHLQDAIKIDDKIYHPLCYEDHKNAVETSIDETMVQEENNKTDEEKADENEEESIEIKKELDSDAENEQMCDVEIDKNNDEENMVVKEEPMETDENIEEKNKEATETEVEEEENENKSMDESMIVDSTVDTTVKVITSSIDGNLELEDTSSNITVPNKIKINITKPIVAPPTTIISRLDSQSDDESIIDKKIKTEDDDEIPDAPPQDDEKINLLKPRFKGRKFVEFPPVNKGQEESGLCSIM